ncbi:hypothetical protein CLAFUW4_01101 [Fulvia fulva]|uniref:BHLH domain-containing protein n=1 Tax=Passalora fulva TaxID=5499 RepID=A0A9Q8P3I0_PASFU|nr:uncharacterized protein CLAFUR5_01106 [Fulvia fulva]KAK4634936.1 hypothetical protein CLAFUR4_01102 [Fulvia fulva]KAK4637722.1 hypothetical protein CLAFUR0_01103 [Fulvia fulva]UJO11953.1 hypothetical protein CLAFUR5_01106 [Fulvia fulva]WPV09922.1 hypothetical protein CLAFUW4_01101 [Fulvia fulva]WPV24302.1 hypothetical protein CLAFUW7_01106 [Fulvia fulva]
MDFKVDSDMLFAPYTNESQVNIQDHHAKPGLALNAADTMPLQRLSDLAQIRQSHILQSQHDEWFVNTSALDGRILADVGGTGPSTPLSSGAISDNTVNERKRCEDHDDYGESDRDVPSDVTAEGPGLKSQITDAEKEAGASPQQRPHAAVEKRYRRTVNTKLQQLYTSIPSSRKFSPDDRAGTGSDDSDQAAKPVVLDKAIQYVQHLTETYLKYDADIEDLRKQLRDLAERRGVGEHVAQTQFEEPASELA